MKRGSTMGNVIRFAVIGDCHHSYKQNYGQRDCLGANNRLSEIIDILNEKELDFVFSMGDLGDGHSEPEAPAVVPPAVVVAPFFSSPPPVGVVAPPVVGIAPAKPDNPLNGCNNVPTRPKIGFRMLNTPSKTKPVPLTAPVTGAKRAWPAPSKLSGHQSGRYLLLPSKFAGSKPKTEYIMLSLSACRF